MIKPTKNFCIIPWIGISESAIGVYRPCCNARCKLDIPKGVDINEAFYSPAYDKMRQQFLNNERPEECKVCWDKEDAGVRSYRDSYNDKFRNLYNGADKPTLSYWDVKFDNKCNLQCRMCNPDSSNQIWKTIDLYDVTETPKPDFLAKVFTSTREGTFSYKDKKKEIMDNLEHVRVFKVTGGEPFLSPDFIEIMDTLIERDLAKNVSVECTTNGTKFYKEYLDRFLHFKEISVNISIDGVDESYDYVRYPYNWEKLDERLNELYEFVEANGLQHDRRFNCKYSCLVNSYNWLALGDLYERLQEYTLDYPWTSWGMNGVAIYSPRIYFDFNIHPSDMCLNIQYLSDELLEEGLIRFQSQAPGYKMIKEFEENVYLAKQVNNPDKIQEFIRTTDDMDRFRKQSYTTLDPLLVKFIDENRT